MGLKPEDVAELQKRGLAAPETVNRISWRVTRDQKNAAQAAAGKPKRKNDDREHREQVDLVGHLRRADLPHAASLNGVKLTKGQAGKAKAAGMTAGEPDVRLDGHPTRPALSELAVAAVRLRFAAQALSGQAAGQVDTLERVADWLAEGAPSVIYVELKAPDVAKRARITDPEAGASTAQRARMAVLRQNGGDTIVAYGCDDALAKLGEIGVPIRGAVTPRPARTAVTPRPARTADALQSAAEAAVDKWYEAHEPGAVAVYSVTVEQERDAPPGHLLVTAYSDPWTRSRARAIRRAIHKALGDPPHVSIDSRPTPEDDE